MTDVLVEKEHHLYGGSSAKYWSNCFGWAAAVKNLPSEPAGEAADKGTALHIGVLERKTQAEIDFRTKGTPVNVSYDDIPNWPKDGHFIADAFWKAIWEGPLEQFITGKQIYIEKKLMLYPEMDAGGTGDIIILHYTDKGQLCGTVGDLKTGYHRVEPDAEQLLFYIAALYLRVLEKGKELECFKTFVYQPSHHEPYTEHDWTKNQILRAVKKYEKAILESRKEKPKFKAGTHCDWCKAQGGCKEYNKYASKNMDLAVNETHVQQIEQLEDEKLLKIFTFADSIEKYISAVKSHIIQRFISGKPVKGLKLVEGTSKRTWRDEDEAAMHLKANGVHPYKGVIIGITEAEERLKLAGVKFGKKSKKKDFVFVPEKGDMIMSAITHKPKPSPKVTTEDDPKPAITVDSGIDLLAKIDDSGVSQPATTGPAGLVIL